MEIDLLPPYDTASSRSHGGHGHLVEEIAVLLSTSYSDAELRQALTLLDRWSLKNDAKTRRQYCLQVERQVIDLNSAALNRFERVVQQLHRLNTTLRRLNVLYDATKRKVVPAQARTQLVLKEAALLFKERNQLQVKQRALAALKQRFITSEDHIASLTSTSQQIDDAFFQALQKHKQISHDCELLLSFEKQTLGSDLMNQTSANINLAFHKLYNWLQRQFKTLNLENPQMSSSVRRALRILAERPSLSRNCLSLFSEARERILSDSFHAALTGTASLGVVDFSIKPIEMALHEPLRYVGDMLAWIHSATVSEREALEILFVAEGPELVQGLETGHDAQTWRPVVGINDHHDDYGIHLAGPDVYDPLGALNQLVDQDVRGASQILQQRIEQVIRSNEDTITAYKLAALIGFYNVTFEKLLAHEAHLPGCLQILEHEASQQFRALVRDRVIAIQAELQQPPADLSPPAFFHESLKQLGAILQTYEASLTLSTSEDTTVYANDLLADVFEPFMSECDKMSGSLDSLEGAIFITNCKLEAAKSLEAFKLTSMRTAQLRKEIISQTTRLTELQHNFFCEASGLAPLFNATKTGSADPEVDRAMLEKANQQLDDFLPSALMDAMERLARLQDSVLVRRVTEAAAGLFCDNIESLEQLVKALDLDVEASGSGLHDVFLFPRTISEIRVLLL